MVIAEIYISQGIDDHRFIIDGETVSENSPMTGFRHKPFESWKELLIEELVEECNRDYFTLKISANISQFEYINQQVQVCDLCKDCIHINAVNSEESSPVSKEGVDDSESAWTRMDRLFQQYGNALTQTKKINFGLMISEQIVDDYVQIMESLVRNGFTRASLNLKRGYFNISLEEIDEDDTEYFEGVIFAYRAEINAENVIVIDSDANSLGNEILSYVEKEYVIPFLNNMKKEVSRLEKSNVTQKNNSEALDFTISIPGSMDKGKSAQIVVIGASKVQVLSQIQCEIDNPDIVSYSDGKITALRAGQTIVKFKIIGKLEYISKHQISIIEHIFVKRIELSQTFFEGLVNDSFKITAICYPERAENIGELKYESLTPNVVKINQNGEIKALSDGLGKVRAYIGEVEAIATVSVGSRVNEIKASKENVNLYLGETEKVQINIKPFTYTEDAIDIKSQNEDIAAYKNGKVIAKGIGETDIVLSSKNSDIESKIHVKVSSTFQKRTYTGIPVQLGIALFVVAIVCIFVLGKTTYGMWSAIAGVGLCIISLFVDKRDKLFSIVFALLNAGILYLLFR